MAPIWLSASNFIWRSPSDRRLGVRPGEQWFRGRLHLAPTSVCLGAPGPSRPHARRDARFRFRCDSPLCAGSTLCDGRLGVRPGEQRVCARLAVAWALGCLGAPVVGCISRSAPVLNASLGSGRRCWRTSSQAQGWDDKEIRSVLF